MRRTAIAVAAAGLTLAVGVVPASGFERRAPAGSGAAAAPARPDERTLERDRVGTGEMSAIREYYRAHPAPEEQAAGKKKRLPPGLRRKAARGGALPPGWQKKVARGEVMDPAVYAHSRPLPPELVRTLPPQPPGTVIVTVEGKAVRLLEATRAILDVFDLR